MNEAIIYDPSFEEFRAACQQITQFYIAERYPFTVSSELSEEEIKESLAITEGLIGKIRVLVGR